MIAAVGAPFLIALAVSLAVVPLCARLARRFGYVAHPTADRWNQRVVPLFGGVAIAAVTLGLSAAYGLPARVPVLIVTATLIFIVGAVDDVLKLKPATKLIAQLALASVLLSFDYRLNWVESRTLDALLTLVWVVGLTN